MSTPADMQSRDEPRVCVVVAGHDAAPFLADTLTSLQRQTFAAWQCVVVDDGSSDDTAGIAERFAAHDARFTVRRQPRSGVSTARNTGIDAAHPDAALLAFLDADDTWRPEALATLVEGLDDRPDAVGVYGTAEYMDTDGEPIRAGAHPAVQADRRVLARADFVPLATTAPSTFSSLLVSGTIWPSGVVLHRRDALERAGGFDPDFARAQDWELYLRMSRLGDFVPLPEQVAWYRRHTRNATAPDQAAVVARNMLAVRWKTWSSSANTRAQRREAERVWRRLAGRWVAWCLLACARSVPRRRVADFRDAAAASLYLVRRLRRPVEPTRRLVDINVRYVMERTAGAGSPLP